MSDSINRNDILWGGESLVSNNCRFLLTLERNGNLVLNGLVGRFIDPFGKDAFGRYIYDIPFETEREKATKLNYDRWYNGWETNTIKANNSAESVVSLVFRKNGLAIEEHPYKNMPGFEPIPLWSSWLANDTTTTHAPNREVVLRYLCLDFPVH